ncbi:MAG: ArsA-related P-loop ATPase [bacterium]
MGDMKKSSPDVILPDSVISSPKVETMLKSQRVVVVIGAGGVGKTTSSIALAIHAARLGRRVALLSIDPAKRLAAALGIELGHELRPVMFPDTAGIRGQVSAAMLDQKAVFDGMVRKHAPSPHIADRILRDPLYVAASTNLSGPLEYMALARLQELAESAEWDLVVLDTPPDSHALDFLGRPNVLSGFVENKVISRLLKPVVLAGRAGLGRVMAISEKVLGGITSVTGFSALRGFGEFVLLMQEVIDGFHRAGEKVLQILKQDSTSFVLVAAPNKASARGAEALSRELTAMGYHLDGIIFNRCLPRHLREDLLGDQSDDVAILKTRVKVEDSVVSQLKSDIGRSQSGSGMWDVRVDDQSWDIHTLDGILAFSKLYSDL